MEDLNPPGRQNAGIEGVPDTNIEKTLTVGAVLMIAMRWTIRLMGFVSIIVLARVLTPTDFGIVAMAMVFQALVQGLANLNVELALIRDQSAGKEHYNTAWSIGLLQFSFIAVVVAAGAGAVAGFFDEPRVESVLWVLAIALFLRGFVNIGVVDLRKELQFRRELYYQLVVNGTRVICTILLALWLRSYWAMIIGILAGVLADIAASYRMSPFRPRPSFAAGREIFGTSAGVWLVNLNRFLTEQADRLILGKLLSTSAMGGYTLAVDLARLPSAEVILPISRAMVPGYAKVKHDKQRMGKIFVMVLQAAAVLGSPIAFGFPIVAPDFVSLVLGPKWNFILPMLQIAAAMSVIELLAGTNRPLLLAASAITPLNLVLTAETIIGLASIYPAFVMHGIEGVLLVLAVVRLAGFLCLLGLSASTLHQSYVSLLAPLARPLIAGACMAALLVPIDDVGLAPVLRLLLLVVIGGILYTGSLVMLWILAKRPPGIEAAAFVAVKRFLMRRVPTGAADADARR